MQLQDPRSKGRLSALYSWLRQALLMDAASPSPLPLEMGAGQPFADAVDSALLQPPLIDLFLSVTGVRLRLAHPLVLQANPPGTSAVFAAHSPSVLNAPAVPHGKNRVEIGR